MKETLAKRRICDMIEDMRRTQLPSQVWAWLLIAGVLMGAFLLGRQASMTWRFLLVAGIGAMFLLV